MINENIEKKLSYTKPNIRIIEQYKGFQNIDYKKYKLNIVDAVITETPTDSAKKASNKRFAHVTNLKLGKQVLIEISYEGRRRWNIENEGFNGRKNTAYKLQHKYSRTSFTATQNYYQCLQIAHMINQLSNKTKSLKNIIKGNDTYKSYEEMITAVFMLDDFEKESNLSEEILNKKYQLMY